MPDDKQFCHKCGLALARVDSGQGCPHCLLRLALTADEETDLDERKAQETPPLPPGLRTRFFADYEVLEEIARGGMGVVYKARQLSLNRLVALKMILASHLFSSEVRLRFRMEVEAVAQLNHPHIVPLYESGEHEGTHFFTMRLVEGGSLAERIAGEEERRGGSDPKCAVPPSQQRTSSSAHLPNPTPLSARAISGLVIKVARAVHHAHQRGILHRDLKPSNILLDAQGEPHVADFGLAKMLAGESGFTFTESILGSPNYMAPEQASGLGIQITVAVDVYGLGAILYELLTGQPPFKAPTPIETLRKVCNDEPMPPRKLNATLDADLETICLKCLRKDPAARYASAEALAADLDRWLEGRPILARPIGGLEQAWRWCRHQPALAGTLAVSLLLLVALAIGAIVAAWRIDSANQATGRMLTRMQLQKAEDYFVAADAPRALALLAHVLRKDPANEAAAGRLVSALSLRAFAVPLFPPIRQETEVTEMRLIPESNQIFTATRGGMARLWRADTGEPIRRVTHAPSAAEPFVKPFVELTRTNTLILRMTRDGKAEAILLPMTLPTPASNSNSNAETQAQRHQLRQIQQNLNVARLSPDGRRMVIGTKSGLVAVLDRNTHEFLLCGMMHDDEVSDARFSPDGSLIVTASWDRTARLWDLETRAQRGPPLRHRLALRSAQFSPDGRRIVTASSDSTARIWDAATGLPIGEPLPHSWNVESAQFSPDGRQVLTSTSGNAVWLWQLRPPLVVPLILAHAGWVMRASFSPDGRALVTGSTDSTARLWDIRTGRALSEPLAHHGYVTSVEFSPDGRRVLTASFDNTARLWDAATGRELVPALRHGGWVRAARFNPTGTCLVTASHDRTARVWDAATGQPVTPPMTHDRAVTSARFSPDGRQIVTFGEGETARVWDAETGRESTPPLQHSSWPESAEFSPDGQLILTVSRDNRARLWTRAGQALLVVQHASNIRHGAFSPDGKRFLTASDDHTARLWDTATGRPITEALTHQDSVLYAEFSRDGRRVVTASRDQTARVWDSATGQPLSEPLRHDGPVEQARFSPDGTSVVTASQDGTAKIWPVPLVILPVPAWLPAWAEALAGQRLRGQNEFMRENIPTPDDVRRHLAPEALADESLRRLVAPALPGP